LYGKFKSLRKSTQCIGNKQFGFSAHISLYETGVHSIEVNASKRVAKVLDAPLSFLCINR